MHQGIYQANTKMNYLGLSPPLKVVAFPKLIDQIKDSESHKSFIKLNNVTVNESSDAQGPPMQMSAVPSSNLGVSFNNQYLNDSIQAANQALISIEKKRRGYQYNVTKDISLSRVADQQIRAAYGKTDKSGQQSLYEMDCFPRRSITNRLKNVQSLQNKKKMRVLNEKTSSTTTTFPHIFN